MTDPKSIDQKFAEWQSLQPLKPEDEQRLWKKLRLEWNYHSNHIEGNTLTYGETELLLVHRQAEGGHDLRNYVEMQAHDLAIEHLKSLVAAERPLGEADIRDLNRILLKEPFWKDAITADGSPSRIEIIPGQYKEQSNNVGTADGGIFEFAPPSEVPARMAKLEEDYLRVDESDGRHPVELASELHHEFVMIHPFGDGNGRTVRLLVNYVLMRAGYPPLIVPSHEKDRYLAALRQADAGDRGPLTEYLGACALAALERGIRAAKGESIEEPDDLAKEIELFKQQQKGESKEVVAKSEVSIRAVYEHTLKALFEEFIAEHECLADLFLRKSVAVVGMSVQQGAWQATIENYLDGPNARKLKQLGIQIQLKGFKGSAATPFNVRTLIQAEFAEFHYGIRSQKELLPSLLYSNPLSASDRQKIVKASLQTLFEEIKKKSGSE